jgi:ectoine hydroxylase-related dioxygenase (phytanoyl-CoA dioxygenase family)
MRDAVWRALADVGIDRDRPSTWTVERPAHLQRLKDDPLFQAVGSKPVLAAIDDILEGAHYPTPENWGAFFIAFPSKVEWGVPASGWHADANYTSALWPPGGVKTHALFGDVPPRSGATLIVAGSHRLIHKWFLENPPPSGLRSADMRKSLRGHPYIRDLHREGEQNARIARFLNRAEEVDGIPLQVVENTGEAGDVILLHPLVLHVAAPNAGTQPRLLLSGGVTTDDWGFASTT